MVLPLHHRWSVQENVFLVRHTFEGGVVCGSMQHGGARAKPR